MYTKPKQIAFNAFTLLVAFVTTSTVGFAQNQTDLLLNESSIPVVLQGVLEPAVMVEAATTETGIVQNVFVELGEHVKAGMPLVQLDQSNILSQIAIAQAEASSVGRIDDAKADLALSVRKLELLSSMKSKNAMESERARTDLAIAEARLHTAQEAQLVSQLQLDRLKIQLQERVVRAPVDGIVVFVYRQPGEYVAGNAPQLVRIYNVSKLKAKFYLEHQDVQKIPTDRQIRLTLADGREVPAVVDYIAPIADVESGFVDIVVSFTNVG